MLPEPISPDIVIEHHGDAMTTSLAIAEGVQLQHKNVLALIRKYIEDVISFGEVAFETRLNSQGSPTEFAWLNEQQATFLLTLMRNSPVVVEFKKALVKAFFALRDQLRVAHAAPVPFFTGNPAHAADQLVSADRIFRGILRSGRSAGLPLPQALRRANEIARERTGIDMLTELDAPDLAVSGPMPELLDPTGAHAFCDAWIGGALPVPLVPCRSEDLYAAYALWRALSGERPGAITRVLAAIVRRSELRHHRARYLDESGRVLMSGFVLPEHEGMPPPGLSQTEWLTLRGRQFAEALGGWRTQPA